MMALYAELQLEPGSQEDAEGSEAADSGSPKGAPSAGAKGRNYLSAMLSYIAQARGPLLPLHMVFARVLHLPFLSMWMLGRSCMLLLLPAYWVYWGQKTCLSRPCGQHLLLCL